MSPDPGSPQATPTLDRTAATPLAVIRPAIDILLELTKARLSGLVVVTTLVGFLLASNGPVAWGTLAWTLLGTALIVGGANAFNQVIEKHRDARMARTAGRPLPAGKITRPHAALLATLLSSLGLLILACFTNLLTAALAFIAFFNYVALYTPLKTRSTLCTLVGAISGAIPPMMGWTAATGALEPAAWLLFALLFVWQIPHFLALAWLCRDDYERGGFVMLPLIDRAGTATCRLVLLYTLAMIPITLVFPLAQLAGWIYTLGALALGLAMLALSARLYRSRTAQHARRLFLATVLYLPLLLGLMIADRSNFPPPFVIPQARTVQLERPAPKSFASSPHAAASDPRETL